METPTGRGWRSWRRVLVVAVGIALAAGVYAAGIVLYFAAQHGPAEYVKNPKKTDQLEALVRTASIDPNKGDLVLRVEVRATGSLLGPDGVSVTRPVSLDVVGATGTASYRYGAGDRISPVEVTIGLSGDVNSYPFDSYSSPFGVVATASPPTSNQPGPAASAPPTLLVFDGTLSGYQVTAKPITVHAEPDLLRLDLSINRAPLTRAFAILLQADPLTHLRGLRHHVPRVPLAWAPRLPTRRGTPQRARGLEIRFARRARRSQPLGGAGPPR
jgi:Domain of unknown function (DUF4436)